MSYCNHCRVHLRGKSDRCVLCGNALVNATLPDTEGEIFPDIPLAVESHLAIRILVFISIVGAVVSFAVRMIIPSSVNWPIFVVLGLVSVWLSLIFIVRKRYNIHKTIVWQVTIVAGLSLFWDWETGWRGWSLDYLIPSLFIAALLVMYITAKIFRLSIRDYLFYALLSGLFGIVPIAFILFGWVDILYPSIICVAISIIFLAALFIFEGKNIKNELNKRMHI